MLLIKEITSIETSPCMADKSKLKAVTVANCDFTYLLPYINAEVKHADYKPGSISFKKGIIGFTIMNNSINITKFDNMTHLYELLDWVKELLNGIDARINEITPCYEVLKYPAPTEIFKLLPKTNCGRCGDRSCLAFAGKLSRMSADLEQCVPMFDEENSKNLKLLQELLP
jgi:ArsR family metal-binding transcriptional regulator